MVAGRPYAGRGDLVARSDAIVKDLDWVDLQEALDAHPRIGESAGGVTREAAWSRDEQSGVVGAEDELARANRAYEDRFGHVFLIRAAGLDAGTVLAEARRRLGNDVDTERAEVREQLRQIVALRLEKQA